MPIKLCLSRLIPSGRAAKTVSENNGIIIVEAGSVRISGSCPQCGTASRKIHSR
jgi:hypothetical protein